MGCAVGAVGREEVEGVMSQGVVVEEEAREGDGEESGVKRELFSERGVGVGVRVWVAAFWRACTERFSLAWALALAISSPWLRRLLR